MPYEQLDGPGAGRLGSPITTTNSATRLREDVTEPAIIR